MLPAAVAAAAERVPSGVMQSFVQQCCRDSVELLEFELRWPSLLHAVGVCQLGPSVVADADVMQQPPSKPSGVLLMLDAWHSGERTYLLRPLDVAQA